MNEAMNGHKFKVGDRVKCLYKRDEWYPETGTYGTVNEVCDDISDNTVRVKWDTGLCFWEYPYDMEYVGVNSGENNMTDEEIWNMLKPKLEKNGLVSRCSRVEIKADALPTHANAVIKCYDENDVRKAIALAYKSGYLRSQKGRPFKIGGDKEPTNEG